MVATQAGAMAQEGQSGRYEGDITGNLHGKDKEGCIKYNLRFRRQ